MTIKFLCPNGHQLTCGDDRAGKPGKCPKCGTAFVVPDAEEIAAAASNGAKTREEAAVPVGTTAAGKSGASAAVAAGGSGKSVAAAGSSPSGKSKPNLAEMIVFLCPNGHRLNGPKSLQGKAGQCPHCGEKFRIPSYDEEPGEEQLLELPPAPEDESSAAEEIPVGTTVDNGAGQESDAVETFPEEVEIVETVEEIGPLLDSGAAPTAAIAPLPPGPSNQLFDVFSRLWSLCPEGVAVELLLSDGQIVRPTKYSPALSRQAFGVFALRDSDGTFRVQTIAWSSVVRIEFSRLLVLPPGVFS